MKEQEIIDFLALTTETEILEYRHSDNLDDIINYIIKNNILINKLVLNSYLFMFSYNNDFVIYCIDNGISLEMSNKISIIGRTETLFEYLLLNDNVDILRYIFDKNINVDWQLYLNSGFAYYKGYTKLTLDVLNTGVKYKAIHVCHAIGYKNKTILSKMLELNLINFNENNGVILKYAIRIFADIEIIKLLKNAGLTFNVEDNDYYNQLRNVLDPNEFNMVSPVMGADISDANTEDILSILMDT